MLLSVSLIGNSTFSHQLFEFPGVHNIGISSNLTIGISLLSLNKDENLVVSGDSFCLVHDFLHYIVVKYPLFIMHHLFESLSIDFIFLILLLCGSHTSKLLT